MSRVERFPGRKPRGHGSASVGRLARAVAVAFAVAFALASPAVALGQAPPPDARWFTFQTPHFQVVFHEGVRDVAFRAAERGERAIERLAGFGTLPGERIQFVVTDHVDLSNGFARAAPYPRIVIWARPPVDGPGAIPFDDWLELVVTHEVVHILHLEMTGPLGRVGRLLMGRAPVSWPHFPAFALPTWAVEGVAVQAESSGTDGGRMHGARFDAIVRATVLEGRGERIDQVMGSSPVYPGGERPYAWGGPFFHHLAEAEGVAAVAEFFHRQAGRLNPLRLNASARDAFGRSLETLHDAWLTEMEADARAFAEAVRSRALAPVPDLLTDAARFAFHPAFRPADGAMAWVRSDGRSEAAIVLRGPAGEDRATMPLNLVSPLSWGPDGTLWTTQPEYVDRYRIRSDLWRMDPDGGRRQVTHGLRVLAVDAHPRGGPLVAILGVPGTQQVVLLSEQGDVLRILGDDDPGVHWAHPRWSPDGTQVALTRWTAGGLWAVAILDVPDADASAAPAIRILEESGAPIHGTAWTPDGEHLVWSSERTGVANLYVGATAPVAATGASVAAGITGPGITGAGTPPAGLPTMRQLSDLVTAGVFPTVTPDGRHVVFSLLTADGWELARLPFPATPATGGFAPLPPAPRHAPGAAGAMAGGHLAQLEGEVRPWSPRSTLRPRHWIPTVQASSTLGGAQVLAPTLGFESWAADAIDRNRWDLRVDLPLGGPGRRWEGSGSWQWAGLGNPVLGASVGQRWDAVARVPAPESPGVDPATAPPLYLASRDRTAGLSASFLRPRFRSSHQLVLDLSGVRQDVLVLEEGGSLSTRATLARPVRDFAQVGATLSRSTARSHAFHPSLQQGSQFTLRLRGRQELSLPDSLKRVAGRDASLADAVLSVRHYRSLGGGGIAASGGAPPVLAVRGAVGAAEGPGAGATTLRVGGGGGGGEGPLGATWERVPGVFQVRGYDVGARGGDRAWGGGAELRVPLAIVHRGIGVLPIHADRLVGTLWGDAAGVAGATTSMFGATGSNAPTGRVLASVGAELGIVHSVLFQSQAMIRLGVAVPVHGVDRIDAGGGGAGAGVGGGSTWRRPGPSVYAAMGWSF